MNKTTFQKGEATKVCDSNESVRKELLTLGWKEVTKAKPKSKSKE